jgi:predicted RNase H-like HicB family nuclease
MATETYEISVEIWQEPLTDNHKVYIARCVDLEIVSQGDTIEQAQSNLIEALNAFMECATSTERDHCLQGLSRKTHKMTSRVKLGFNHGQPQGVVWA